MNDALRLSFRGDGWGGLWMPPRPAFEWFDLLLAFEEEVGGHRTEFCLTSQFIPCIICEWSLFIVGGPPAE